MLKIHYSPYYTGRTFRGLSDEKHVLLDEMVADDCSLLAFLQLNLGLHPEEPSPAERLVLYHRSLSHWLQAHPDNELHAPFEVGALDVARQCLEWRDELRLCGWTAKSTASSERLKALQGAEATFHAPGAAERLEQTEQALRLSAPDSCAGITLQLPFPVALLHPAMQRIVGAMEAHGASVLTDAAPTADRGQENGTKSNLALLAERFAGGSREKMTLDQSDESFLIYNFADDRQAARYMAAKAGDRQQTLWVNADSKTTDNWLRSLGKAAVGSKARADVPQMSQLLMQGIALLARPLNIHTLLDWLQPDLHPLNGWFRRKLSDTIAAEGGWDNEKCRKVTDDYLNGVFTTPDAADARLGEEERMRKRAAEKKRRKELRSVFLPCADSGADAAGMVATAQVSRLVSALESWARTRAFLMSQTETDSVQAAQLRSLAQTARAMQLLLDDVDSDRLALSQVAGWAGSLLHSEEYVQCRAEVGSPFTITHPGCMTAPSDETMWWNVDGDTSPALCCAFLMPSERRALEAELTFWDADKENALRQRAMLTPITHTRRQLTLARCETRGGEPAQKHPLMVRIENQVSNWRDFVRRPDLRDEAWEDMERTCNETGLGELHIQNAALVRWPSHLSATTMDTLIQWPLDFVMEHIVRLQPTGPEALAPLRTTKGNVAHAVIARLFAPRGEDEKPTADVLRQRVAEEYDEAFDQATGACGALLHLPENVLEAKLLKEQLAAALRNLVEIIDVNRLRVTGCERFVKGHLGVLDGAPEADDVVGFIDMILEDTIGHRAVFDFKWTSSRSYYRKLLSHNESLQLQLYRRMLGTEGRGEVERVAYFLMPEARLYSTEAFEGSHCVQLECDDCEPLLEKVRRSVLFRRLQIAAGVIENGDGKLLSTLAYAQGDDAAGRVPLKAYEEDTHDANMFSNYTLFKR